MSQRVCIYKIVSTLGLAAILCGCVFPTYRLTSTPPGKFIVLTKPARARYGIFGTVTLPAGEYVAKREDARGFLYYGTAPIIFKDIVTEKGSGGLYIPKTTNAPSCYFLLDFGGRVKIRKFDVLPQFKFSDHRGTNEIYGAYDEACIEAVQKHWYQILDHTDSRGERLGKVNVMFDLRADGSVTHAEVIFSNVSERYRHICMRAIMESAPFGSWPQSMRKEIGSDKRKVTFTFYYD